MEIEIVQLNLGEIKQHYICEDCDYDGIESLEDVDKEVKKEKIKNFVEENKCPHCGDTGEKHILQTKPEMTFMWCYSCQKHFNIVYKRIAVDLILD